jgi:hypothetical protein
VLQRAVVLDPAAKTKARKDRDFDGVRRTSWFVALTAPTDGTHRSFPVGE